MSDGANLGTRIKVVSKYCFSYNSFLSVEMVNENIVLNWRVHPVKLGVDIIHLKEVTVNEECFLQMNFNGGYELIFLFEDKDTCHQLYTCIESLKNEAVMLENEKDHYLQSKSQATSSDSKNMQGIRKAVYQVTMNQEMTYQLNSSLRLEEAYGLLKRLVIRYVDSNLSTAFKRWTTVVREANKER